MAPSPTKSNVKTVCPTFFYKLQLYMVMELSSNKPTLDYDAEVVLALAQRNLSCNWIISGLFHRVILMSGSGFAPWAMVKDPQNYAFQLGEAFNCSTQSTKWNNKADGSPLLEVTSDRLGQVCSLTQFFTTSSVSPELLHHFLAPSS